MRAYLTGASGFVGRWLREHLEHEGDAIEVLPDGIDILDGAALRKHLEASRPEVVYHLAALAHVGDSFRQPERTLSVNALGTLELLEAARACAEPPRVLLISSAEVYGGGSGRPIDEEAPLRPTSPYAASKVAAEFLGLQAFLAHGLEVVRVRPFNHVGPGQSDAFVVPAFARRLIEAERSGRHEIAVGDLSAARDFTDVRDVVRAYRMLALKGVPGEAYNVCSGEAVAIRVLLDQLVRLAIADVRVTVDPALLRPVELPVLKGSPARLVTLTGWRPQIPLEQTLEDVLSDWRARSR